LSACLAFVFLLCGTPLGQASEVALLHSLLQEVKHHRRRLACVVRGVGRLMVTRLAGLPVWPRVPKTAIAQSMSGRLRQTRRKMAYLLHRVRKKVACWLRAPSNGRDIENCNVWAADLVSGPGRDGPGGNTQLMKFDFDTEAWRQS
jgi:hypothetical protein